MKLFNLIAVLVFTILALISCNKDDSFKYLIDFNDIPIDKYTSADIFENENSEIYGNWRTVHTEETGIVGVTVSLSVDFDFLLIKPNAIFGVVKNEELITSGEVIKIENPGELFQIKLETEDDPNSLGVEILRFNNLNTFIRNDSMRYTFSNKAILLVRDN